MLILQKNFHDNNNIKGIFFIILAALFFSLMSALVKITFKHHDIIEIMFLRSILAFTILTLLINVKKVKIEKRYYKFHFLRSLVGLTAMFCTFTALESMPLSNVTIISFAKIFFIIPLAFLFFQEKINIKLFLLVITGFSGVIIIIGFDKTNSVNYIYYMFALSGAFCIALVKILIKKISLHEGSINIQFWFSLFSSIILLFPYLFLANFPSVISLLLILFITIFSLLAQFFTIEGLRLSTPTIVMPFDFFRVIFASVIGIIFFLENISISLLTGSLIIFFSCLKIIQLQKIKKL